MHIRSARESDFPAIAALTNTFIHECAIHFSYKPVTADELRALWLSKLDRYPWLVAEVPDERGVAHFAGYAKAGAWRERDAYAWVVETGIYVSPHAQGKGVGRALYDALFALLREQGFHTVVAGVTLPNRVSVRLHESCGFRAVGTFQEVGWKLERWHAVGFWQLDLAPPGAPARPIAPPRMIT